MDENKIYYVYQWINDDTNEIFYVGKGCKDRYRDKRPSRRNQYFMRYVRKHTNCHGEIIVDGLSETEAYEKEKEIISDYLQKGYRLTNLDEGGRPGGRSPGEANGMYGKTHTPEAKAKIIAALLGVYVGPKNPNARPCDVLDTEDNLLASFPCI